MEEAHSPLHYAARLCGGLVCIAALISLWLTMQPFYVGAVIGLASVALFRVAGWTTKTTFAVSGLLFIAGLLGSYNRDVTVPRVTPSPLSPGQYTAHSEDLLGLVTVRLVVREGGALIFAEAHAPPGMGIDGETLDREIERVLFHQALPVEPDPESTPLSASLVRSALAAILSGDTRRTTPTLPEGAQAISGDADTYWGMFPNERNHQCDVTQLPDGLYVGTSSNPVFPATVTLSVFDGQLNSVDVLDARTSEYGEKAIAGIPVRMVESNSPQVDVLSGATRTSLILRSAAFHACRGALEKHAESPRE